MLNTDIFVQLVPDSTSMDEKGIKNAWVEKFALCSWREPPCLLPLAAEKKLWGVGARKKSLDALTKIKCIQKARQKEYTGTPQ